jgi:hypothetical protein
MEDHRVLSITDLLDFIDLDRETVELVNNAMRLPVDESITLARQLLATEHGLIILHHMYRDQISDAVADTALSRETALRQAYRHFSRKYPIPELDQALTH